MVNSISDQIGVQKRREEVRPVFENFWDWLVLHDEGRWHRKVLEVGVGPNGFAPFYAAKSESYVGLDVDEYTSFYKDLPNATIITYDGLTFPLEAASIDLAVSHSVFEHITNVPAVLAQVLRVLKPHGLAMISINPMYYSSWGSHGTLADHLTKLPPWSHLDPASSFYMTDCPPQLQHGNDKGCYLNKLTMSAFLAMVAALPFSILRLDRAFETMPLPGFLQGTQIPEVDLRNHDFRILLRKDIL